jgi:hypothetical protein
MKPTSISSIQVVSSDNIELPPKLARSLRRADGLTKNVVCAAAAAFQDAKRIAVKSEKIGIFFGTSLGPLETNFRFLDTLLEDGEGLASPTLFSHSVHNAAPGYLARIFKIYGPSFALTSYAWPFLTALRQAVLSISSGVIARAVVVTGEMGSPLMYNAANRMTDGGDCHRAQGAVAWVIDACPAQNTLPPLIIRNIEIDEQPCDAAGFLLRTGEKLILNGRAEKCPPAPLAYAFSISSFLKERLVAGEREDFSCTIKAPFGQAELQLG